MLVNGREKVSSLTVDGNGNQGNHEDDSMETHLRPEMSLSCDPVTPGLVYPNEKKSAYELSVVPC